MQPENEHAVKIIATEWNFGASSSPRDKAEPTEYGGVKVPRIFKMAVLQHFFDKLNVTAELMNFDTEVLAYLSADDHPYFGGDTLIHGTLTVEGNSPDRISTINMEVFQRGSIVATCDLANAAKSALLTTFPSSGKIQVSVPQLLFELPSAKTASVNRTKDSELILRVSVRTSQGLLTSVAYGPVQLLVRFQGALRIAPSGNLDTGTAAVGGDDWVLPNVNSVLNDFPDLRIGDISKMNGGSFPPHQGHDGGDEVEATFSNYGARNAATAQKLLTMLNDPLHGFKIRRVYVTFLPSDRDPFWMAIKDVTLFDGRAASATIIPRAGYEQHFQMRILA